MFKLKKSLVFPVLTVIALLAGAALQMWVEYPIRQQTIFYDGAPPQPR